jgi:hypothetical protein
VTSPGADFDSPWKDALTQYLPDCLALLLPDAHAAIDWERAYQFLDKELQQVAPEAAVGRRLVDALVQVWRRDGSETWVLIHIEVQGQEEPDFARRMYGYYARIRDRFDHPVVSLAILTDERRRWRPDHFRDELWGCAVEFRFPIVKLADYRTRRAELERDPNPFAVVILAHLAAQETRSDTAGRASTKLTLIRRLYERGYSREQVIGLFRFIDWVLRLPTELDRAVWRQIQEEQEARGMPYVTSFERLAREEGREEGLREGLRRGLALALEARFGAQGQTLIEELRRVADQAVLEQVAMRVGAGASIAEIRAAYQTPGA